MSKLTIDPVSRLEGHLKVTADVSGGKIVDVKLSGEMFRGFEFFMLGKEPLDSVRIVQRVCGVCHESHGIAASMAIENACGIDVPKAGHLMRNLILALSTVQSHLIHFYHLSMPDYIDFKAVLKYNGKDETLNKAKDVIKSGAITPFLPREKGNYCDNQSLNIQLIANYVEALEIRTLCSKSIAILGAKTPFSNNLLPGGCPNKVSGSSLKELSKNLKMINKFVTEKYIADVKAISTEFKSYFKIGRSYNNFIAYDNYVSGNNYANPLLKGGLYRKIKRKTRRSKAVPSKIYESIYSSYYKRNKNIVSVNEEVCEPDVKHNNKYSWIKSPRYNGKPFEAGSLARMMINKNDDFYALIRDCYGNKSIEAVNSVCGRHIARTSESKLLCEAMNEWYDDFVSGDMKGYRDQPIKDGNGFGLVEAPRGALLHYHEIKNGKTARYQIITPTAWNCSPITEDGVRGPMEKAILSTKLSGIDKEIVVGRIIRAFDPCLACAVH